MHTNLYKLQKGDLILFHKLGEPRWYARDSHKVIYDYKKSLVGQVLRFLILEPTGTFPVRARAYNNSDTPTPHIFLDWDEIIPYRHIKLK